MDDFMKKHEELVTDADHLQDTLEQHGVAIIPSVLDQHEIDEMKDGFWTMLTQLTTKFDKPISKHAV